MAAGGGDPWKISGEERAKHDAQFFSLKPVNGFVTGAQARDFFMQSGLSTVILGQIWTLADMNNDGKMDKLEFSVAMHLIKKKLQGYELPKVLPASLKAAPSPVIGSFGMQAGPMAMGQQAVMGMAPAMHPPMGMPISSGMMPQASLGTSTMTTGSVGMPLMANGIGSAQGMGVGIPPAQPAGVSSTGWSMPHPSRLKYTQLFNTHDRNKRGSLTGVEARGILMQTGLPQPVLSQIWTLSDVDGDGRLTLDEFCIAMHFSDMARLGRALPQKLPAELIPSKGRSASFGSAAAAPTGINPSAPQAVVQQKETFGDLLSTMGMPQAPPAQLPQAAAEEVQQEFSLATFEDKRKENFDKGQAELERRRALLQEQMKAEENARLEKERREAEKRERIRMEQEAKRQEELQRQLEKQRKIEMERDEQRRKMIEQREQARRDLERQHQMEWERQRKEQLMAEKQREYEQLATLKSQNSNLKGQLESLDGKKTELTLKISQVRSAVSDLTASIESMRVKRDNTIAETERAERESTELNQKLSRLNGEKEQLQTQIQTQQNTPISDAHRTVMHSVELKRSNIQKLRRELEQVEQETETRLVEIDNGNIQMKSLQSLVDQLQREIPALQQKQQELKRKQEAEKASKDKQRQEQIKKELEAQRKKEAAEKVNSNGSNSRPDNWFDFNSGGEPSATPSQVTEVQGDAWGNAFSSSTATSTATVPDVWGSSDPFSSQVSEGADIKKTLYKVLFPFESRSDDELNINPGDQVMVWNVPSQPGMEEWLKGELNGMVGWFPQAYAEPMPDSQPSAFSSQQKSSDLFGSAFQPVQQTSSHTSPVSAANSSVKSASPPVAESVFQPTPGEAHKAPEGLKAQALYQWKARQDNHLSFNKDDIISVQEQEDMWWMGELNGKVGWFPKAYVKLVESEKSPVTSSQMLSPVGTLEKNGSARASPAPDTKDGEYYVATYSYVSGEATDLSFNDGDMILVTNKDEDWWTGVLGDKTGIFPANYVKKVEIQPVEAAFVSDIFRHHHCTPVVDSSKMSTTDNLVAPPRRLRTKKKSESEISSTGLEMVDVGVDFAESSTFVASASQSSAVAPPRQSKNKKGNNPKDLAAKEVLPPPDTSHGIFDFGADLTKAFPSQVSEEVLSQPLTATSCKLGFDSMSYGTEFSPPNPVLKEESKPVVYTADLFTYDTAFRETFPSDNESAKDPFPSNNFGDHHDLFPSQKSGGCQDYFPSDAFGDCQNFFSSDSFGGCNDDPFPSDTTDHSAGKNKAHPFSDAAFGLDFSEAFPSLSEALSDDALRSATSHQFSAENVLDDGGVDGKGADFAFRFSKPVEKMRSPVSVSVFLSESSLSASSSAAELSAIADLSFTATVDKVNLSTGPLGIKAESLDSSSAAIAESMDSLFNEKVEFFADSADATSTKAILTQNPVHSLTKSSERVLPAMLLVGVDGDLEPADLPPPSPVNVSFEISDIQPRTTSASASECDQAEATAEFDEPGQKSAKKPEIAMVIAPYTATGSGQLSLESGNLIHVRQKSPRGWWEGELQARGQRKKIGWFPANYVKLLGSSGSARSTPDPSAALSAGQQQAGGSRSSTPQPQPTTPAPPLPTQKVEQLVALYAYTAQNVDELTFEKDALITLVSRDDPDWWQGELNGQTGLFPSNYVTPLDGAGASADVAQSWLSDSVRHKLSGAEKQRQHCIQEMITTEETYNADMSIVLEVFDRPLTEAGVLSEQDSEKIFVNWNDLIICNKKFLQALRVRKKMSGKGKVIFMIGDILCENLPHMKPYVRFCSCQLTAASLLQQKTENNSDFVEVHKKCMTNPAAKNMPLSSFLLKPMQRITRYPLLIKKILQHTPSDHPDYSNLVDALQLAEELCSQVNEGVRERENSDRLEWIQRHVHCDGLAENITFNSVTNCLGSRKLLHTGVLYKVKSNKELLAFLFNDFLLLTIPPRFLGPSISVSHIFDSKSKDQYKMYKTPVVLNEVKYDAEADPCQFQISHIERVYHLRAPNESERDLWVKQIDSASRKFREIEDKKRERAHSLKCKPVGRLLVIIEEGIRLRPASDSARCLPGVGRLLVVILEGCDLRASDSSGKSDPYCEVSMGSQEHRTRVVNNTLNPKWNASMQFTIRDLRQDVLCITVYDRDLYSPNDLLGRTEVRLSEVLEEAKIKKGPITKRLILHEVDTGEVIVKLDLQLYES